MDDRFRPRVREYYDDNDFTPGDRKTYGLETSDKSGMVVWGLGAVCIAGAFLAAVLILAS